MNTATKTSKQDIEIEAAGETLRFGVTRADYNKYVNAMTPNNKVGPTHNFLIATIHDDDLAALNKVLESPGSELVIGSALIEEYTPDLAVTVKKRKT